VKSELSACGASVVLLEDACTTTFLHSFRDDNPDQRISSVGNVARSFTWDDIKPFHAKLFYVNPLFFGEVSPSLFPQMKQNCEILFVDSQGLLRRRDNDKIYHKPPDSLLEIFGSVDILKVDAEEAAAFTGITGNTEEACAKLLSFGLKSLICTQKEGVAFYENGQRYWAEFGKWTLEGRTGRGDTVSAAFLLLRYVVGMDAQDSLNYAAQGCSNKMMHPGAAIESDFASIK
jgi:sugar/nucleoside kinase (ribokinase family)